MPQNDFLPFARSAGANIITPAAFNPSPTRQTGFQNGIADPAQANTVIGQSQSFTSMLAQFIVDTLGQDVIDNGNIATLEGQFIAAIQQSVGSVPQAALWHFGRDTGAADLLTIPAAPIITAYADGMIVSTIINNTNLTTSPHMSANGLVSTLIVNGDASALTIGVLQAGSLCAFQYDAGASHWRLIGNVSISQASLLHRTTDVSGTANAMVCSTVIPPIAALVDGMTFNIKKGSSGNNAATNLTIAGVTAPVTWGDGTPFTGFEWPANADAPVMWDSTAGGNFRLLGSPSSQAPAILLRAAISLFVDPSGNDANDGLAAGTSRALKTIQAAIAKTILFNLNGFNVTISVAAGTYAGPVVLTPAYGSGRIFLTGAGFATTTVASTLGSAFLCFAGNQYKIDGFTGTCSAPNIAQFDPGGFLTVSGAGASVVLGTNRAGVCQGTHLAASNYGVITGAQGGGLTISGGLTANSVAPGATLYAFGGQIGFGGASPSSLNISAAVNCPFFAYSTAGGLLIPIFSTIGSPSNLTGTKFSATNTGGVVTNGGLAGLPGSVPGSAVAPGWAN